MQHAVAIEANNGYSDSHDNYNHKNTLHAWVRASAPPRYARACARARVVKNALKERTSGLRPEALALRVTVAERKVGQGS